MLYEKVNLADSPFTLTVTFVYVHLVCLSRRNYFIESDMCPNTCPCCRETWGQMEPRETEESQAWRSVQDPYHRTHTHADMHIPRADTRVACNIALPCSPLCFKFRRKRSETMFAQRWVSTVVSLSSSLHYSNWTSHSDHSAWVTILAKLYGCIIQGNQ